MPDFATFCYEYPVGESNPYLRIESPLSCPLDERGMLCAHRVRKVGREALESSSAVLQTAAIPSQLPALGSGLSSTKKARCRCDTGLCVFPAEYGQVSQAQGEWIRRLIGKTTRPSGFAKETQP